MAKCTAPTMDTTDTFDQAEAEKFMSFEIQNHTESSWCNLRTSTEIIAMGFCMPLPLISAIILILPLAIIGCFSADARNGLSIMYDLAILSITKILDAILHIPVAIAAIIVLITIGPVYLLIRPAKKDTYSAV